MEKLTEEFYKNEDQDQETDGDDEEKTDHPNNANAENETTEPLSAQKEVEDASSIENLNDKNENSDSKTENQSISPIETDLTTISKIPQEKTTSKVDDHANDSGIGKKHALKKCDQFALNTSCFWGK